MFRRRRSDAPVSRGQALVETALLLPILALLLVMAIDFGRVFFGWVALQNAARVGADFAAGTADAWEGSPSALQWKRDRYFELIEDDIRAINCALAGGTPPDPTFVDGSDTAPEDEGDYDDGDFAVVEVECNFSLITPLAESILGGSVKMLAHEEFPIHSVITMGIPSPPALPGCPAGEAEVPEMDEGSTTMEDALDMWIDAGFEEDGYLPEVISTGPPSGRNNDEFVLTQTLPKHECFPVGEDVTVTYTNQ